MNYHGKMMNIPCVIPLLPEREYTYVGGHRDARHAAAEIANEADTTIAELIEAAEKALAEMRDTVSPRGSFTDAVDALDAAIARAKREQL